MSKTVRNYQTGLELRQAIRSGAFAGQTAGQAPNHLQGNIVILPLQDARDFLRFCLNNPKPCPLIGIALPGDYALPELGKIDIRVDVPEYRIFEHGEYCTNANDISDFWQADFVTFVLGCSFTFEEILQQKGYIVRHIAEGKNVPMFKTNIQTVPAGKFAGPLVVTMRSFHRKDIPDVFDLSAQYPHAHGAPVFWGNPSHIGINDLGAPDFGDPVEVPDDEVPVFWACGVTPQAAMAKAKPAISITHAPGCMLVTDVPSEVSPKVSISLSKLGQEEFV